MIPEAVESAFSWVKMSSNIITVKLRFTIIILENIQQSSAITRMKHKGLKIFNLEAGVGTQVVRISSVIQTTHDDMCATLLFNRGDFYSALSFTTGQQGLLFHSSV